MRFSVCPWRWWNYGLSAAVVALSWTQVGAQYAATRLYTLEDGLPVTETTLTYADSKGFLWIGTNGGGIVRYDGREFRTFPQTINTAVKAVEDAQGNIWFRGSNQDYTIRIEPDGRVYRLFGFPLSQQGPPRGVFQDSIPAGNLQISRKTGRLLLNSRQYVFQYDPLDKTFAFLDSVPAADEVETMHLLVSAWPEEIISIHRDGKAQIHYGVFRAGRRQPIALPVELRPNDFYQIFYAPNGDWLFLHQDFIGAKSRSSPAWTSLSETINEQLRNGASLVPIKRNEPDAAPIILLRQGDTYAMYDLADSGKEPREVRFHFKGNILTVVRDPLGNYWAASHSGLLWISSAFTNFFSDLHPAMPADIHVVAEDAAGRIWFGSYGHGLSIYDGQTLEQAPAPWPVNASVLPGSWRDRFGNLLLILQDRPWRGLFVVSPQGRIQQPLPDQAGYFLSEDKRGRVLFGSQRNGLFIQRHAGCGYVDSCWIRAGPERGFGLGNVLGAAEDRHGHYWMGRSSKGMAVYLPERDTVFNFFRETNGDLGAWNFVEDRRGRLWVGTNQGLHHFDPPGDIDAAFPLGDSLRLVGEHILGKRDIRSLALYQDTLLAILTDRAFALLHIPSYYENPDQPVIYHFDKKNGYFGGAGEQNAFWIDRSDRIWFANDKGVVRFDPRYFLQDTLPLRMRIDLIRSFGDVFYPQHNRVAGFQPKHTNLTVTFSPDGQPNLLEDVFFYYQLNNDPLRGQREGAATYSNLAPGKYVFTVFAERHGRRSAPATVTFRIPAVWYRNPWTYLTLSLIAGTALWLGFQTKQKRDRELLNARLHVIVNQLNPHFINNSLNWVGIRAADRNDEAAAAVIEKLAENIRVIFQNSRRNESVHSLWNELRLVENYFCIQRARFGERIAYLPPQPETVRQLGGRIFVPLMMIQIHAENALEHGLNNQKAGGWVKITLEEAGDFIRILVEDNGIGRPAARKIRSLGTQQGVKMIDELIGFLNQNNRLKISQRYEDDIFTGADGRAFGTRVVINIPKQYKYDLSD